MALFLDEDFVGTDPNTIHFPNLLSCMGVIAVLSNGHLAGCHITGSDTERALLGALGTEITGNVGDIWRVYMIGNGNAHFGSVSNLTYRDKATAIGHQGDVYVVNTKPAKNQGGSGWVGIHVKVTGNGGNSAPTFEKANEPAKDSGNYGFSMGRNYTPTGTLQEVRNTSNGAVAGNARFVKTGVNVNLGLQAVPGGDIVRFH